MLIVNVLLNLYHNGAVKIYFVKINKENKIKNKNK